MAKEKQTQTCEEQTRILVKINPQLVNSPLQAVAKLNTLMHQEFSEHTITVAAIPHTTGPVEVQALQGQITELLKKQILTCAMQVVMV